MPYLSKVSAERKLKEEAPPEPLTTSVQKTLAAYAQVHAPTDDAGVAKIEVHDTISNVAWAYEKLRQAIDYQDEHLLRKNAIERILRRRLVTGVTAEELAEPLVLELIRGRYLANNAIPVTAIQAVADTVNAYVHLWTKVPTQVDDREADRLFDWYIGLLAADLNQRLSPPSTDAHLVQLMFTVTHRDITFAEEEMDEHEKNTQLFVAIHRALLKSDPNIIRFHLFLRRFPEWNHPNEELVQRLGARLPQIRQDIESQLFHPAGELLQRIMKKYAIIFHLFDDVAHAHGTEAAETISHPDRLAKEGRAAYAIRRKAVTAKIARSVIRSIIYVFLTKMLLTLLIELPADRWLAGNQRIDYQPLVINMIFPPALLMLIGVTIRPPGKKNEEAVIELLKKLVYHGDERHAIVKPRKPIRRSAFFIYVYRALYTVLFLFVFGGIIGVLTYLGFTPVSTFIFILFLTIVSFFGIRVRLLSKELLVVDQRENLFTVLFDFFTVPILQVGRWISLRAPKINVLIFFLDVIIEAPFKAFLEAMEGFFGFLREKREEIY